MKHEKDQDILNYTLPSTREATVKIIRAARKQSVMELKSDGIFRLTIPEHLGKREIESELRYYEAWMERQLWIYENEHRQDLALSPAQESSIIPRSFQHTSPCGKIVTVTVDLSTQAKRCKSSFSPSQGFTLTLPSSYSPYMFKQVISEHMAWVDKMLLEHPDLLDENEEIPETVTIPLLGGEKKIEIVGNRRPHYSERIESLQDYALALKWQDGALSYVIVLDDRIRIFGPVDATHKCEVVLKSWCLRTLAPLLLIKFFMDHARQENFPLQKVSIRDQKSRWASCSSRQNISLNWRAVFLDLPLLEHLCWHELCHLHHMNHGKEYHEELERLSPNWRVREKALDQAWTRIPYWAR